ncbi:conserved hypothetical protein [Cellulomonas flavigena DSM 20109]|uniref:Uncharacterized protein n=1 Tax=Cellulomonas flavigena (strain ATCC 482 / DSM 20109 / BCRC 11376 / JCM 18109 / NBRC 3775 / NCIMB 8073 / NRS 134) TaxID=446466 RepID=D5UL08_CELFN|nr:hypothetical protein [Cellulomonas flavigena]ADG75890.1 conserved hypothetical protein [Cellulomonas flavigena DSM 20109]
MTGRAQACGALLLLLAVTSSACGPGHPPAVRSSATPASAMPTSAAPLPPAVTFEVEVAQARTDRVARIVELQVRNTGPVDVVVERARLVSDLVGGGTEAGRDVGADRVRRLRVPLGPAACGPDAPGDPAVRVELDVTTSDGRAGTVVVAPTDEADDLRRIHGEDCAAAAVAAGLRVTFADDLVVREVEGVPVADVTLRVEPVPGGPHVRLTGVRATTLLRPWGATGRWDVDVDSAAPPPDGRLVLATVPARCDLHAIAEDKRGTVLGLAAVVDGVEQPLHFVAAPDALRGALYEFVLAACGGASDARP